MGTIVMPGGRIGRKGITRTTSSLASMSPLLLHRALALRKDKAGKEVATKVRTLEGKGKETGETGGKGREKVVRGETESAGGHCF
jgi:hypothetical protein